MPITSEQVNKTITERIDEWGEKNPDGLCYDYNHDQLTYSSLKRQSDALAVYLNNQVTISVLKDPIIVYGHMSSYMLISFIGSAKAGIAYIPIDVSMPVERIKQIIEKANPSLMICTQELPDELMNIDVSAVTIAELKDILNVYQYQIPEVSTAVKGEEIFYIIFTSGSTGTPKGVQISHDNLQSFSDWMLAGFSLQEQKRFINQAPFSFDLSVMDLYPCLLLGGTIVPLDKETSGNMKTLYQTLPKLAVNVWVSTPSFVELCLLDSQFNQQNMKELTHFIFCGEVLNKESAKQLLERFPNVQLYNTYGPTEATVAFTSVRLSKEVVDAFASIPLGRVKYDSLISICDENGHVLPEGQAGEIILIGPSVSIGYLADNEKTAKVFYKDDDRQAYKTGDCGIIEDGFLFFKGRMDFQVKLHGYRIELEDIENNLKETDYVQNCIVVPKWREGKVDSLVAFVVVNEHSFEKEYQLTAAIKKQLLKSMPAYMIPRKWIYKQELPLTSNSKIDRKQLSDEVNSWEHLMQL
ncbi:D-alanine--poly(phosphoribitol) ligase subunit DltA [Bacillus massiliigorillae]|uniref:D-alanine--poly(phosphoribitol) ligase subunit DltA n=1 Tax=Bacillus massiliigorillae TaxID=1243664 RepID=UPI0003A996E5|nr:D-alanine--poly(phosphoribitol) ligase subunit DltA [Bacillus massiliigorillae]